MSAVFIHWPMFSWWSVKWVQLPGLSRFHWWERWFIRSGTCLLVSTETEEVSYTHLHFYTLTNNMLLWSWCGFLLCTVCLCMLAITLLSHCMYSADMNLAVLQGFRIRSLWKSHMCVCMRACMCVCTQHMSHAVLQNVVWRSKIRNLPIPSFPFVEELSGSTCHLLQK